jgi:hypothetical protein
MNKYQYGYIAFFSVLCLNFIIDHYKSVYPSVVFPSFSSAPSMNAGAVLKSPEIFGITFSNNLEQLNERELFNDLYNKHTNYVLLNLEKRIASGEISVKDPMLQTYLMRNLTRLKKNYKSIQITIAKPIYSLTKEKLSYKGHNEGNVKINLTAR